MCLVFNKTNITYQTVFIPQVYDNLDVNNIEDVSC